MSRIYLPIILILTIMLSQVSCGNGNQEPAPITVRPVKQYEQRARDIAKEWQPDAFLFSVSVNPLRDETGSNPNVTDLLSFQFVSPSNTWETLDITFSLDGRAEITKWPLAGSPNDFVPIASADWVLDSTDAWRIAAEEIRRDGKHSSFRNASLQLERWKPSRKGQVLWYVVYRDYISNSVRLWIDPQSGEIVDKQ